MKTLWPSTICPSETVVSGTDTGRKSSPIQRMIVVVAKGDCKKLGSKNKQKPLMLSKRYRDVRGGHSHKALKIESEEKVKPLFWEK